MLPASLDGGLVRLRWLTSRDAAEVQRLADDPRVAGMTATIPHPYPAGAARAWIATHAAARRRGDFAYAITSQEGGLVGTLGLRVAPNPQGNIGYWIGRPYWGCGYATAAAQAGIDALFAHTALGWLMAAHLARNEPSAHVLAKCGMREVARATVDHRGVRAVLVIRRIDRVDWARTRAAAGARGRTAGS